MYRNIESVFADPTAFAKFPLQEINLLNKIIESLEKQDAYKKLNKNRLKLLIIEDLGLQPLLDDLANSIVNQLKVNANIVLNRLIYKPGSSSQFTPWHQDGAYWGEQNMLRVWIALEDFDEQSGCLKIHKEEQLRVLLHSSSNIPDYFLKEIKSISDDNFHSVKAQKGDVILFNELSVHGSFPNRSQHDVRAITGYFKLNPIHLKKHF